MMKPISEAWFCQIELTTHCGRHCLYCTRFDRHLREDQRVHMTLATLKQALNSLWHFPGRIGIIGGEPTLHPQFQEVCELIQDWYPRERMGLWTAGGESYNPYLWRGTIAETFGMVAYNPHTKLQMGVCRHQPLTIAIKDVVEDPELRQKLIDDCWVQRTWCPSIAPWGRAYFCEVAYSLDLIQDHHGGWELTHNWWDRTPEEFGDQLDLCQLCGMAVPLPRQTLNTKQELVSPSMLELLRNHHLPRSDEDWMTLYDHKLTINELRANAQSWYPGNYRGDLKQDETASEGKGSTWL